MKRELVEYLACPACLGDLEVRTPPPGDDSPDSEIVDGLLTCRSCERWYPIRDRIPELYPDHLRDWARDLEFFKRLEPAIRNTADHIHGASFKVELTPDGVSHGAESAICNTADLPRVPDLDARAEGESPTRKTADHIHGASLNIELMPDTVSHGTESTFGNAADLADVPTPYVFSEGESIFQKKDRAASERAADRAIESSFDLPISPIPDPGASYKLSEMTIASRVDDPDFFSPGRTAPFNPSDPESTTRAIRRFGVSLALLDLKPGAAVLDAGTGYAWTSEWLSRSGFVPIGLDICRTYLDIGLRRMGAAAPHLIAADVESLPLKTGRLDAVLAFDAFHHIPDRPAALAHFSRALKSPGRIVLAEPGPGHGREPHSVEVMKKYGILEKGMSRRDVASYCRNLPGVSVREHHVFRLVRGSLPQVLRTASDMILAAVFLVPGRPGRSLLSEKTRTRLKKTFRISDYRFFVVDKGR